MCPNPPRVACVTRFSTPVQCARTPPVCQETPRSSWRPGVMGPGLRTVRARRENSHTGNMCPHRPVITRAPARRPAPAGGMAGSCPAAMTAGCGRPGAGPPEPRAGGGPGSRTGGGPGSRRGRSGSGQGQCVRGGRDPGDGGERVSRRARGTVRCLPQEAGSVPGAVPHAVTSTPWPAPTGPRHSAARRTETPLAHPAAPAAPARGRRLHGAAYVVLRTGWVRTVRLLRRSAHPPSSGRMSGN